MKAVLSGTITDIFPAETFGTFEKRVFWLKQADTERYPNHWALECWQGDANLLDSFKVGDEVTASIDIRGKFWSKNGREGVINSLKCWRLVKAGGKKIDPPPAQNTANNSFNSPADITEPLDDLPF